MSQNTFVFKTNLNCSNCVSKIQKDFDTSSTIESWIVDTNHPNKILTVVTSSSAEEIKKMVSSKGFKIEEETK